MSWLHTLERKGRRFSIPHLMYYISAAMLAVFLMDMLFPGTSVQTMLYLDIAQVMKGQVWRLLTFIILPPSSSPLWILFNLYFYCLIGDALEREWGSFKFNLFYLCGMAGTILGALITGSAVNHFLNLSLFFAFAALYPNFQLMIFFILPIKIKWLALIDGIYYLFMFITGTWSSRAAILFSLLNVFLFFGKDFLSNTKRDMQYWKTRRNFRKYNR